MFKLSVSFFVQIPMAALLVMMLPSSSPCPICPGKISSRSDFLNFFFANFDYISLIMLCFFTSTNSEYYLLISYTNSFIDAILVV